MRDVAVRRTSSGVVTTELEIAALTEVAPGDQGLGEVLAHALLIPTAYADGANQLTAYVVDGPVGAETLHPLEVHAAG